MKTDERARDNQASAGDDSVGQIAEMEEIIDLVDEVPTDDDAGNVEQTPEIASKTEDEEELIELTDVVAESNSEARIGGVTLEISAEEAPEPEGEQAPEEEELIELVDEVVPEADSEQEEGEEEPIELTDEVLPKADSPQEQEEVVEPGDLAEGLGLDLEDSEEDSAIDTFDFEMTEEGSEVPAEEELEDPGLAMLEEAQEASVDTGEPQLSEDQAELGFKEGVPEAIGGALEQAVLEKLPDGRLEEIITSAVKQAIEGKVERILLEAAEAAIGKEIERLKKAL